LTSATTKANCGVCSTQLKIAVPNYQRRARNEERAQTISQIIAIPVAIALLIWTLLITITAFVGGQAPFFFIDFDGFNIIRGLFWLIVVDPIVLTIAYWIYMLVMLPILGILTLITRNNK